jgi:hypothetical protein
MSYRRNDVLEAIVTKVTDIKLGDTVDFTFPYRFVTRDPIGHENIGKMVPGQAAVGVYDTAEEKFRNFGSTNAILTVVLEFYYMPKTGQGKSEKLNMILAELTKAICADQSLNGTALTVQDVSNNLDIDGIYDKIVNGSITFQVTYRHGLFDPTSTHCNN